MTDNATSKTPPEEKNIAGMLKKYLMVILTLIFVFLYAAAFYGKLDPLKDNALLLRFEPIIFLLIGYYFARLPVRQTEKTLKDEIARQMQKADAAQYAKEKAQQERETLEEKIKNAKTALMAVAQRETNEAANAQSKAIRTVAGILDS
jgi:uncharacterized protein YlxW (UPF0749 family)